MLESTNIIFIPEHILKIPQLIFRNMHLESLPYAAQVLQKWKFVDLVK